MHPTRKLWRWLGLVFVLSFAALGFIGWQIYLQAPPIPKAVATADGELLFGDGEVTRGQQAWLAAGGQQLGTVWGHGSYVARIGRPTGCTARRLRCAISLRTHATGRPMVGLDRSADAGG